MCQEVVYQQDIEESSAAKCVVQIDFTENYTCVYQDEVCPLEPETTHCDYCMCVEGQTIQMLKQKNITPYAVSTVHDKSTALAYLHEVFLAADIDGRA